MSKTIRCQNCGHKVLESSVIAELCVACRIPGNRPTTLARNASAGFGMASESSSGHNALNAKFEGLAEKPSLSAYSDAEIDEEYQRRLLAALDEIKIEW